MPDPHPAKPAQSNSSDGRFDRLRRAIDRLEELANAVGALNPRPSGWHHELIQKVKKMIARALAWYTRPSREFDTFAAQALREIAATVETLSTELGKRDAAFRESVEERINRLEEQVEALAIEQDAAFPGAAAARMEADWDLRARENSRFYIDSGHSDTEETFEKSGEWDLENQILRDIELDPRATVLEIGCGTGRLLKPLAHRVARAIGIDVSGEMVRQARARLSSFPNVRVEKTEGDLSMVESSSIDFCFSYIVFQHFHSKGPIFTYFREASRVLCPGGIFRFQVNQRREQVDRLRGANTWDAGVGLNQAEILGELARSGFGSLDTWGEMTHYAWYTAEEVKKHRSAGHSALVRCCPPVVNREAAVEVFQRLGLEPDAATLDALVSRRLAWRTVLDSLIPKWSALSDENFIQSSCRALLNREMEHEMVNANILQLQDGRLSRSVFLDGLVSSKEFRDVLGGVRARE